MRYTDQGRSPSYSIAPLSSQKKEAGWLNAHGHQNIKGAGVARIANDCR
jgi:hypothetical protein